MDQPHTGTPERLLARCRRVLAQLDAPDDPIARLIAADDLLKTTRSDLIGLIASLEYFVATPSPVPLVAMAGQYSGGKSSTINALIGRDIRDVGMHETDKVVTLVTSSPELGAILSEQSRTNIGIGEPDIIDAPFLSDKALIDTPGVNDPTKYIDLANNFLPICDVIVYVFASTPPMTPADVELLRKVLNDLHFIPVVFAVQKCDNFRLNKTEVYSAKNRNQAEMDEWAQKQYAHLERIALTRKVRDIPFHFVSSDFGEGVQELARAIEKAIPSARWVYERKVNYFDAILDGVVRKLDDFLGARKLDIGELVQKARSNRSEYDAEVESSSPAFATSRSLDCCRFSGRPPKLTPLVARTQLG